MKDAKDCFLPLKAERLSISATGSRQFWPIVKTIFQNFYLSNFLLIRNSSGRLIYNPSGRAKVYASRFASTSAECPTALPLHLRLMFPATLFFIL